MEISTSLYIPIASHESSGTSPKQDREGKSVNVQQGDTSGKTSPEDRVSLSPEARDASQQAGTASDLQQKDPTTANEIGLTPDQQQQLRELKSRDREVRTHEQAHLSAAGQYAAGSASFTYQQGPDGSRYAVGGEVPIDISKGATPEETILKMATVRAAALAPAEPSAADRQIAAQAAMTAAQARQELVMERQEGTPASNKTEDIEQESENSPDSQDEPVTTRQLSEGTAVKSMIHAYTSMQALG